MGRGRGGPVRCGHTTPWRRRGVAGLGESGVDGGDVVGLRRTSVLEQFDTDGQAGFELVQAFACRYVEPFPRE